GLDRMIKGGLATGEVGAIEGKAKGFKTGVMINFGKNALLEGADVVHITLELREDIVASRYDGCLFGMRAPKVLPEEILREVEELRGRMKQRLYIKGWPIDTATPAMI